MTSTVPIHLLEPEERIIVSQFHFDCLILKRYFSLTIIFKTESKQEVIKLLHLYIKSLILGLWKVGEEEWNLKDIRCFKMDTVFEEKEWRR